MVSLSPSKEESKQTISSLKIVVEGCSSYLLRFGVLAWTGLEFSTRDGADTLRFSSGLARRLEGRPASEAVCDRLCGVKEA